MLQVWGGLGIQTSRIDRDWSASAVSESFKGKDKYYQCFLKTRARARHISIIPAPQEAETGDQPGQPSNIPQQNRLNPQYYKNKLI